MTSVDRRRSLMRGPGARGNAPGNLLGLAIVTVAVVVSRFSLPVGITAFANSAYGTWVLILTADIATRPRRDVPLRGQLTSQEFGVYRKYHTCIWFPGAAHAFSALLNLSRLAGLVWAGLAFWAGNLWVGVARVACFFLVGTAYVRCDPCGISLARQLREWLVPLNLGDQHLVGRMVALGGEAEE
jgi:hypothetical protein